MQSPGPDRESVLAKAATIQSPELVQALKDFLDGKLPYDQLMKMYNPALAPSCCQGAK